MMATGDLEFRIARLSLAPGEVLVVKTQEPLPLEIVERFRAKLQQILPGTETLFIYQGVELSILSSKDENPWCMMAIDDGAL